MIFSDKSFIQEVLSNIRFVLVGVVLCGLMVSNNVVAMGVGAAKIQSFIGEQLDVSIPIFNVDNPDALVVSLDSTSLIDNIGTPLEFKINRANSQLSVGVTSQHLINEPYVNFVLKLSDSVNSVTREFTVLLNLPPAQNSQVFVSGVTAPSIEVLPVGSINQKDVLGPYDWAEANNIPSVFGAVIDGQSLWRVARRINKAMDVTIEQMMVALYSQNPTAFSSTSVDSLKAGSYLTIPSLDIVQRFSTQQAKKRLQELSSYVVVNASNSQDSLSVPTAIATGTTSANLVTDISAAVKKPLAMESSNDQNQTFQVSSIVKPLGSIAADPADDKSTEIINSLAITVGNLTQELISKDKQIQFLEEKIEALEGYQSFSTETRLDSDNNNASTVNQISSKLATTSSNLWWWSLLLLMLASVGAFFLRVRLGSIYRELNLFGNNEAVEFEPSVMEVTSDIIKDVANNKDYSVLSAVPKEAVDNEVEGVSFLELDSENTEGGKLNLQQRIDRLLIEKDFDFARELLEFARHNEIDDQHYHFQRMRLAIAMGDEPAFYDYYYAIETKISKFDENLRNGIGNMISTLGQQQA